MKKTARIIESEEEYVANEEDEDEEAVEETGEDKPESEEVEAESAEETTPPVVTKKVIKLPILAKIPKSPRARGRGRGKGGIQRNPKLIVKPPVKPPDITPPSPKEELIVKEQASPAKDQELEVEEQSAIPAIAANPDSLEEEEAEMMMEDEEYANKQLKLMAIQLAKEKEKKRKEFEAVVQAEAEKQVTPIVEEKTLIQTEAQKVELPTPVDIISQVDKTVSQVEKPEPKKRGRRKKYVEGASPLKQQLQQTQVVPPIIINKALLQASMANTNTSDQEKPICSIENSSVPTVIQDLAVTPPKRRGRGKGKKTIAAEQAAAAAAAAATSGETSNTSITANSENSASGDSQTNVTSSSPEPNFPGGKLGIAAPPQPFSQNQPTPSVITRMLQSQPMTNQPFTTAANAMNQKYFGGMNIDQPRGTVPSQFPGMTPRGRVPSPYKQNVPPGVNHYPGVRNTLAPGSPHRLRSPGPPNLPQMFHSSHHPLDPSPSGGGHVTTTPRDRQSPGDVTMTTKGGPTPPPPPQYSRASMSGPAPTTSRFPNPNETAPGPSSSSPARPHHMPFPSTGNHMQPASPPRPPAGGGNFSPYHPPPPPNYHYGAYPPPPSLAAADDAMPPTVYQSSPYPEHYNPADGGAGAHTSEGSNSKPFDEEGSGEFGGLVSYFSSQREDDLDA